MSGSKRRRRQSSSDGSRKIRPKKPSNSPSASSSIRRGQWQLDKELCWVLCHPLGLPLVSAFHGEDPRKLPHLRQESDFFSSTGKDNDCYDGVLNSAVQGWRNGERKETILTSILTELIRGDNEIPLKVEAERKLGDASKLQGRVDITLYPKNDDDESTHEDTDTDKPLLFLEVGLNGADWWRKFDQGVKYVQMKYEKGQQQTFKKPILLAIMTVEDRSQDMEPNEEFVLKLGVFLCTRKHEDEDEQNKKKKKENFRISLLWHSKTRNLQDGSKVFGRLLRRVCDFSSWIAKIENEQRDSDYEYYSSNCCRVGDWVLRCYDSRFRETSRSPEIYLRKDCEDIVGEGVKVILNLPVTSVDWSVTDADNDDELWQEAEGQSLLVIATRYRPGNHEVTKPTSFVLVIDQLQKLHDKGLVHGDIRAFNIVFDEDNNLGHLIDFDFGGTPGREYPEGYRKSLEDGKRRVDDVTNPSQNIMKTWHDWYALGRLIFNVYNVMSTKGMRDAEIVVQKSELDHQWESRCEDPTSEMIDELKAFLTKTENAGWSVQPSGAFEAELKRIYGRKKSDIEETNPCATASPPDKQG